MSNQPHDGPVRATGADVSQVAARARHLMAFYLAALAVVIASVLGSVVLTQVEARNLQNDAGEINISGRQRMLSQRIIYLAQDLVLNGDAPERQVQAELTAAISEFEAAIDLFETAHRTLSTEIASGSVHALYFDEAKDAASLDTRVRSYIAQARELIENPSDLAGLDRLKQIERDGLLRDLDRVVAAFEDGSVSRLDMLRQAELYSLLLAMIIIAGEVAFVFIPGHRLIRRTLQSLAQRGADLTAALADVDRKNRVLSVRNAQIAADAVRLENALLESEHLRAEQTEFTYSLSHDLKSPANTLHLLLGEMDEEHRGVLDADGRELLSLSIETAGRMGALIEDVLQYSQVTGERAGGATVDLDVVAGQVIDDLKAEISACDAAVLFGPLGQIQGHAVQLRVLLQNLVSNALKFQADGVVPQVEITASALNRGGGVCLRVRDNGIGIAKDDHTRIFGLFQRLHLREAYSGTGLGLATCLRVARNHGGEIRVVSAEGEGTTFEVDLRGAHIRTGDIDEVQAA